MSTFPLYGLLSLCDGNLVLCRFYIDGEMVHINVVLVLSVLSTSVNTEFFNCVSFNVVSVHCILYSLLLHIVA